MRLGFSASRVFFKEKAASGGIWVFRGGGKQHRLLSYGQRNLDFIIYFFFSFDNEDLLQKGTVATSLPDQLDLIYEMGKERFYLWAERERNFM